MWRFLNWWLWGSRASFKATNSGELIFDLFKWRSPFNKIIHPLPSFLPLIHSFIHSKSLWRAPETQRKSSLHSHIQAPLGDGGGQWTERVNQKWQNDMVSVRPSYTRAVVSTQKGRTSFSLEGGWLRQGWNLKGLLEEDILKEGRRKRLPRLKA